MHSRLQTEITNNISHIKKTTTHIYTILTLSLKHTHINIQPKAESLNDNLHFHNWFPHSMVKSSVYVCVCVCFVQIVSLFFLSSISCFFFTLYVVAVQIPDKSNFQLNKGNGEKNLTQIKGEKLTRKTVWRRKNRVSSYHFIHSFTGVFQRIHRVKQSDWMKEWATK